jgi:hypothetical protein
MLTFGWIVQVHVEGVSHSSRRGIDCTVNLIYHES